MTPTTPLTLDVAAQLAFPDGSITGPALRGLTATGRGEAKLFSNQYCVTLNEKGERRDGGRAHEKAPASGSGPVETTERRCGLSSTEERNLALAAARATLREPNNPSPITSPKNTTRRKPSAKVIPIQPK